MRRLNPKGFIQSSTLGVTIMNGRVGGFAKVDNRFGYEKWLQGGCKGLALLWSKKKRGKLRCLLLCQKKNFFFIFMKSLLHRKKKNAPLFTTANCSAKAENEESPGYRIFAVHLPSAVFASWGRAFCGGSRYWVGIIATAEVQCSTRGLSARRRGKHNLALL